MDFRTEFFPLLNKALFKEKNNVPEHLVTNSDIYMLCRYTSFYHPKLVELLNSTMNQLSKALVFENSGEFLYETLTTILPPLNKKFIKYVAKKKDLKINKSDTFVKNYSRKYNISEREVYAMLYLLEDIDN